MAEEQQQETAPKEQESQVYKTQEDVDRAIETRLSRERKKYEQELKSRPTAEAFEELKAKLAELSDQQELSGKSHIEKLQLQHSREMEKLAKQRADLEKQIAERDSRLAQAEKTLFDERRNQVLAEALAKKGVFPAAARKALQALTSDLSDVEFNEKGALRASYGDLSDEDPEKIAEAFLNDNPYFAKAQSGGAGTKNSNGVPMPKNLNDLSNDELLAVVSRT